MRMHMLSGGRPRMSRRTYYPDAERGETFELPVSCVLLRHAQGNVLFATDLFLKSLDEIAKLEASGEKVICGHDAEQWDSLQKGPDACS